ncbi:hypothetical protein ACFFON_18155 [Arthrobacter citreus]|uniref:hypothetical protein n=1 Tax=Arthrobacter TaxID=1663 RepID=UPI0012650D73|nr:hypothetical protein [Arthrobacter gandavensis]
MKKTVAELFTPEDGCVFIPLMWGGRKETPAEVVARAAATMEALVSAVPENAAQELSWMRIADDGLGYTPAPSTAADLKALAAEETDRDPGPTTLQLLLFSGNPETGLIASFGLSAGAEQTYLGNSCTITLEQGYPLGTAEGAQALFRELVRIWQPESAILSTDRTVAEIENLYDTYAGYTSWISLESFGVPPRLESAAAERFGDGTLLTAAEWTIEGIRRMHQELLALRVPSLAAAAEVQVVPQFPVR